MNQIAEAGLASSTESTEPSGGPERETAYLVQVE